jgi:hypothetical protein
LQERLDGIEATLQRLEQSAMPNPPLEPPTRLRAK